MNFFEKNNNNDLIYIILPFTVQLRTSFSKVAIKYIGPLLVFKMIDPHNFLLMMLDSKIL